MFDGSWKSECWPSQLKLGIFKSYPAMLGIKALTEAVGRLRRWSSVWQWNNTHNRHTYLFKHYANDRNTRRWAIPLFVQTLKIINNTPSQRTDSHGAHNQPPQPQVPVAEKKKLFLQGKTTTLNLALVSYVNLTMTPNFSFFLLFGVTFEFANCWLARSFRATGSPCSSSILGLR